MIRMLHRARSTGMMLLLILCLTTVLFVLMKKEESMKNSLYKESLFNLIKNSPFEGFNNETGTENGDYIVPNIVHFLFFGSKHISYVGAVCVLAAFKNQRPDKIIFHTDSNKFKGPHWEKIKRTLGHHLEINILKRPKTIFGQKLGNIWHTTDVVRIKVLMTYGGIFLDNDSYLVKSLDPFRKYEIAMDLEQDSYLGTQVIVAHKDARFLRLYLETYREYSPNLWYYNAGQKPTMEIFHVKPELVHIANNNLFGLIDLSEKLYRTQNWKGWKDYYTIHLMIRHRYYLDHIWNFLLWPQLDETNIHEYPMTFREIALDVYDPHETHISFNSLTTKLSRMNMSTSKRSPTPSPSPSTVDYINSTIKLPLVIKSTKKLPFMSSSTEKLPFMSSSTKKLPFMSSSTKKLSVMSSSTSKLPLMINSTKKLPLMSSSTRNLPLINTSTNKFSLISNSVNKLSFMSISTDELLHTSNSSNKLSQMSNSTINFQS